LFPAFEPPASYVLVANPSYSASDVELSSAAFAALVSSAKMPIATPLRLYFK
jgi:hypothetical protein